MKQFFRKAFIFLALLYLVDKPAGYLLSKAVRLKQYDNRIELLQKDLINKEIMIVGSSRAVNDISPEIIMETTGKSCYNLGYSGSNLLFHESIVRLILAQHRPDIILLTVDGAYTFIENEKGIYRKDKLAPFLCYDDVLREYTAHSSKKYLSAKLSWLYRENQNFFDVLDYLENGQNIPDETSDINEYGAILLSSTDTHLEEVAEAGRLVPYKQEKESPELLGSFEYIMNACKKEGVELHIIIPPNYQSWSPGFNKRVKELVGETFTIHDFSADLQQKEFYFDNGHLNRKGALEFSKRIAERLES